MRIIDGTANTPNYVTAKFIAGSLPMVTGRPRPPEVPVLDGGKLTTGAHFVTETDEVLLEPVTLDMTFTLVATLHTKLILSAMSNPFKVASWQPDGSTTFAPVTSMGSVENADGTSTALPAPRDDHRKDGLVNVEIYATNPDGSGDDFGVKFQGVYFTKPRPNITSPVGELATTLEIYGAISNLTASGFTTPVNELT
ncbi:MAG: hypothetical protein VW405_02385 [Rhodospirillaceae bacterium]